MRAASFWRTVTADSSDFLSAIVELLTQAEADYCVIGGQAVNAYVEPLVSLDLDLAVAADDLDRVERLMAERFVVERFPHSLNVSDPGSDLRVQLQLDPRYAAFVEHAEARPILGITLPTARIEDVLQGKIWAASADERRPSKRQKDFADIARIIEQYPHLRVHVPQSILARLV